MQYPTPLPLLRIAAEPLLHHSFFVSVTVNSSILNAILRQRFGSPLPASPAGLVVSQVRREARYHEPLAPGGHHGKPRIRFHGTHALPGDSVGGDYRRLYGADDLAH